MTAMDSGSNYSAHLADKERGSVQLDDVMVAFDSRSGRHVAVESASMTVPAGQFVALVGPSGCGKTTLLNVLAGLLDPASGRALIDNVEVSGVSNDVGYLFQRDALLPWKTVIENVQLPLRYRGVPASEARERAQVWLERVRLAGFEEHYPHQLSGGMRKRVALATIFVYSPRVLLMDEPFSALDVQTRNLMENELLEIWSITKPTVLFVTHDLEEAIGLADRVVVFTAGPGRIKADYDIELPRPRELTEIRFTSAFEDLHRTIWGDLRSEVLDAYRSEEAIPETST